MTDNQRDTKFAGFARLLWEEMLSQTQGYWIDVTAGHIPLHHPEDEEHKIYIDIIAQRAYDLVEHASEYINDKQLEEGMRLTSEYMLQVVPDLTKWLTKDELQ